MDLCSYHPSQEFLPHRASQQSPPLPVPQDIRGPHVQATLHRTTCTRQGRRGAHPRSRTDSSVCVYESRRVVERTSFPPLSPSPSYMPTATHLYASIRPFIPWVLYMSVLFFFPRGPLRRLPPLLCHGPPLTHSRVFSLSLIVFISCLSTRLVCVNPRTFACTSVDPSQSQSGDNVPPGRCSLCYTFRKLQRYRYGLFYLL